MINLEVPKPLQDSIIDGTLIVFVGAGLSINHGLPDWKSILIKTLKENEEYISKAENYAIALESDIMTPLEVLDKIKEHKKIIYTSFERQLNPNGKNSEIHSLLGKITSRFITTNFDSLIEHNSGISNIITHESDYNLSKIDNDNNYVIKIHGDISRIDKCVIFTEQYKELYCGEKLTTFQLKKLLSKHCFMFVGFSFNDPYVKELFNSINEMMNGFGPTHYFVTISDDATSKLEPINIVRYDNLKIFFEKLLRYKKTLKPTEKISSENGPDTFTKQIDGSDSPPSIRSWVGREKELSILRSDTFKVIFITGFGGEGKSALASHYISAENEYEISDWRDFKEEDHKFQHKIVSMIKKVDHNTEINKLMGLTDEDLVDLFFAKLSNKKSVFVLDNIDSYIELEEFEPVNGIGYLFRKAISLNHNSKFIFTCRPFIRYAGVDFYQLSLSGLTEKNTVEYFKKSTSNIARDKIEKYAERSFKLTNGHALWLSLIVAQSHRGEKALIEFLDKIESGITIDENDSTILSKNVLSNVWTSLRDRDRLLLRTLAESVVSENTEDYAEILRSELNYNQYQKALKALRNFNLIVEKREGNYIELHPLVKEFIRKNYPKSERKKFISLIVRYYDKFIYILRENINPQLSFDEFSNFTNKAELSINAGDYQDAINSLWEIHNAMTAAGYNEEFLRVSRLLLASISWSKKQINQFENFYPLMEYIIKCLIEFGDDDNSAKFINNYEFLIDKKDEAYIRLCDLKSYRAWFKEDYKTAINICEEAIYLLEKGKQEDKFNIKHTLALTHRDCGTPGELDKALNYFKGSNDLVEILNPELISDLNDGPMIGNIGKCMQLKGETQNALICYAKSFHYLFKSDAHNRLINLGYASFWLADLLISLGNTEPAYYFYRYAFESWSTSSPFLCNKNRSTQSKYESSSTYKSIFSQEYWRVEKYCTEWVKKQLTMK
ncbi:MAG: SIR2 family protein [Plesiomonas shigelloides]